MKKFIVLIVMLYFEGMVWSWKTETVLMESGFSAKVAATYTDSQEPHYTHIFSRVSSNDVLDIYHTIVGLDHRVVKAAERILTHAEMLSVAGAGDGLHLFLSFATDTHRMYFIESEDGGNTWKNLQELGISNSCNKLNPTILYSKEFQRLWVFYLSACDNQITKITVVTRPKNSLLFGAEKYIYNTTVELQQLEAVYTFDSKLQKSFLHLQWANIKGLLDLDMLYSFSTNSGITWSEPFVISQNNQYPFFSLSGKNSVLASTYLSKFGSFARMSLDNGKQWGKEIEFRSGYLRESCMCGEKGAERVYILVSLLKEIVFEKIDAITGTVSEGEPPFAEESGVVYHSEPFISCVSTSTSHFLTASVIKSTSTINKLVFNTHEALMDQLIIKNEVQQKINMSTNQIFKNGCENSKHLLEENKLIRENIFYNIQYYQYRLKKALIYYYSKEEEKQLFHKNNTHEELLSISDQ